MENPCFWKKYKIDFHFFFIRVSIFFLRAFKVKCYIRSFSHASVLRKLISKKTVLLCLNVKMLLGDEPLFLSCPWLAGFAAVEGPDSMGLSEEIRPRAQRCAGRAILPVSGQLVSLCFARLFAAWIRNAICVYAAVLSVVMCSACVYVCVCVVLMCALYLRATTRRRWFPHP